MASVLEADPITSAPALELIPETVANLGNEVSCAKAPSGLPLFVTARKGIFVDNDAAVTWLREHKEAIDDLVIRYGALVLRGFPVATSEQFNKVIGLFPPYRAGYRGGAGPRAKLGGAVMEATQITASVKLLLHSEMAYVKQYPPRIAFFCAKPADVAGETIIADMRELTRRLPNEIEGSLRANGVRNIRNFAPKGSSAGQRVTDNPDNRGWDDAFDTEDPVEVEAICEGLGIEPIWNDDGTLTLVCDMDAFTRHPVSGEELYRNVIHTNAAYESPEVLAATQALRKRQARPSTNCLGDGTPMPADQLEKLTKILDEITLAWPWESGDVMILDNLAVAHGRNPYRGTRDVQVALLDW